LEDPGVEVLQVPYNVFDQRWRRAGVLEAAVRRGVRVIGRSALLQGLLVLREERVPQHLADAIPWKRRLNSLAAEGGIQVGELALRYALTAPEISSTIVGVDCLEQFERMLDIASKGPLGPDLIAALEAAFAGVPQRIVVPSQWI